MMHIKTFLFGLTFVLLVGCDQSYEASKQQRMQMASHSKSKQHPILIGIPWTSANQDGFINGVKLAVKEINQKGGVLNNIPLQIIINDSESDFYNRDVSEGARRNAILNLAKKYAENSDLIAVIGHASSETSMIASVIYQNNGILFLAPNARYSKLTGHNFNYVFRTSLDNEIMGKQLADYIAQKGYKHIAVLSSRTDSIQEFVNEFTTYAVEKHAIDIVYRRSFFEDTVELISLIAELKSIQNMDAIFIATNSQKSAEIYQQIRNMGIKLPIIGNANLDTNVVLNRIKQWEYGKKIQKSNIPTLYNSDIPKAVQFAIKFQQVYGQDSDYLSALGYDSVNLLAHAIQYSKSTVPLEIATTLRYMNACKGVTGKYEFELNGNLKSKPLSFYHVVKNELIFERVNNHSVMDDPNMEICNEVDRDHDGIATSSDACPDTTKVEMAKGVNQDGAERGCPVDSDNDEIPDYKDLCPHNTAAEISKGVDAKGCPVDYDKDGIPDYADKDVDGDKVANELDQCPKTTVKEMVYGVNPTGKKAGCPVDTDGDGVLDYLDACRTNTQIEISQGVDAKGCPVDLDFDDVPDYQDKCLKTPEDLLVDNEGCEALSVTMALKSAKQLFVGKQFKLSTAGTKYLDGLLVHSNLALVKKVQIIGYAQPQGKVVFQSRLQSIASYFQQKKIPAEKIEIAVQDVIAKKNNAVEIIFSEVKLKPTETDTNSAPQSAVTEAPAKIEAAVEKSASKKPEAGTLPPPAEAATPAKPDSSTPPIQPSH